MWETVGAFRARFALFQKRTVSSAFRPRFALPAFRPRFVLPKNIISEGSFVVTEHVEQWKFHTGETIDHPFTSVMEINDSGLICRWHDYSHLGNLLDQAPNWWLEHIANGWRGHL